MTSLFRACEQRQVLRDGDRDLVLAEGEEELAQHGVAVGAPSGATGSPSRSVVSDATGETGRA